MISPPWNQVYQLAATREAHPEVAREEAEYAAWCRQFGIVSVRAYDVALTLCHPSVNVVGAKVLETGAAGSLFGPYITDRAEKVVLLDNYSGWPEHKVAYNDEAGSVPGETWQELWKRSARDPARLRYMENDMTAMPIPDDTFDLVVCYSAVEHVPDDIQAMREMGRVLKPGGIMVASPEMGDRHVRISGLWTYTEADLFSRLIEPSGCALLGEHDFEWLHREQNCHTVGGDGTECDLCSCIFFLRKPTEFDNLP